MESKQSNKRRLQKKASENNSLEYSRISSVSEENEKYPENGEDSAILRDYYDEYINSRNTSQSTNRDVYSSCDDQSDSENDIVKDTQKINGTETSKKGRSRKSSKSRSPRRSLSRKGSKRSSSRRNKKSKEIQRDKSPNKHDSQRRKPERISSKNTRKSTGNNRFRSLVNTRIWIPKTHDENPKMISESDTSSDSDSDTWKDTESEISTSSKTKHESCVSQLEQNEEPKRIFSSENAQNQNFEAAEKRNKRSDKKVKSSSIRSKVESDVRPKSSEQFCEEDSHKKNWPGTHDENYEKYSEDEKGSASSLNSSHTYTLVRDEKSVSNLPMTETCEEIKTPRRKKESNKRKHERKRKTKDEATMTEEGLFSLEPHLTTNGTPEGNNTHSDRDSSHYDSDGQPDQNYSEAQPDHHDNEVKADDHDNEAQLDHQTNETQSVSSVGSGHLERLCAKYGVGNGSSDANSDSSEDEKEQRIKANVERNEEDTTYNYRPTAREKAEESLTEDSTDVVNGNVELENDNNNNEKPQRKRSVTFSEAIAVTEPVTKETTEELVNDDVDKLAAELTVCFLAFAHC